MEATQAPTLCTQQSFSFQALENRKVEVDFSGGYLSSDGGSILLREIDSKRRFTISLAGCFSDHRCEPLIEHELEHLLARRIHAIALGYEDINDHDKLRLDPVLALSCNEADLLGGAPAIRRLAFRFSRPPSSWVTLPNPRLFVEKFDSLSPRGFYGDWSGCLDWLENR